METFVFFVGAAVILGGALGVVLSRNTTHAALSLIATLFGVAVLFVAQEAHFLAAVQVIVYAGAIVVLFLFVLMLLGVDRDEVLDEPIRFQRPAAIGGGVVFFSMMLIALSGGASSVTGMRGAFDPLADATPDVVALGRSLFTDYVFALEATALLLTIAVVGAVVLVRKAEQIEPDPEPDEAEKGAS
ncbi:MAG: NADH-quinone oxidoreductase subunit J [Acidimicrobiales bacterium]